MSAKGPIVANLLRTHAEEDAYEQQLIGELATSYRDEGMIGDVTSTATQEVHEVLAQKPGFENADTYGFKVAQAAHRWWNYRLAHEQDQREAAQEKGIELPPPDPMLPTAGIHLIGGDRFTTHLYADLYAATRMTIDMAEALDSPELAPEEPGSFEQRVVAGAVMNILDERIKLAYPDKANSQESFMHIRLVDPFEVRPVSHILGVGRSIKADRATYLVTPQETKPGAPYPTYRFTESLLQTLVAVTDQRTTHQQEKTVLLHKLGRDALLPDQEITVPRLPITSRLQKS